MTSMYRKNIGRQGELLAASFLEKQGFTLLKQNFCVWGGEIDILAQKKNVWHAIEVKTRTSEIFGSPLEGVSPSQLERISRTFLRFLQEKDALEDEYQIDLVTVLLLPNCDPKIEFYEAVGV